MNTSDEELKLQGDGDYVSDKMKNANTTKGQTSSSRSHLQVHPPLVQPAMSSFLEMLATLSHEFHSPLTVIEGYTSMLLSQRQRLGAEEQDEFLQMTRQAGRRLQKLTERLFEIAQFEAGSIQLDYGLVDISTLAQETITQAKHQIPEALRGRLSFSLQCRDASGSQTRELPPVKGDAQRLHQVLSHLVENAIFYSPTGGRIDVIARPAPQTASLSDQGQPDQTLPFLEICVCDLGIGIADEHIERIFDPFYRVDTSLTRENYGLGLGLTACKHLVALHQGRIWAESCPAGGSAFHVWLPLAEEISVN